MSRTRVLTRSVAVAALCGALAACRMFDPVPPYADSQERERLQVPDGLDQPATDPSLGVPQVSAAGGLLDKDAQRPPEIGAARPIAGTDGSGGTGFDVQDQYESVYRRVGLALERSGGYPILARDDEQTRYRIEVRGAPPKRSWWKFWQRSRPSRGELVVQVSGDAEQATVSVTGAAIHARETAAVVALLRERLRGD